MIRRFENIYKIFSSNRLPPASLRLNNMDPIVLSLLSILIGLWRPGGTILKPISGMEKRPTNIFVCISLYQNIYWIPKKTDPCRFKFINHIGQCQWIDYMKAWVLSHFINETLNLLHIRKKMICTDILVELLVQRRNWNPRLGCTGALLSENQHSDFTLVIYVQTGLFYISLCSCRALKSVKLAWTQTCLQSFSVIDITASHDILFIVTALMLLVVFAKISFDWISNRDKGTFLGLLKSIYKIDLIIPCSENVSAWRLTH